MRSKARASLSELLRTLPAPSREARFEQALSFAANAITLLLALWQGWSFAALVWPYWLQSVAIGAGNVARMSRVQRFSTEGVRMNDAPVPENAHGRGCMAAFFCMHYGLFHLVYLMFLIGITELAPGEGRWVAVGAAVMVAAQIATTRRQMREDATGTPNLGTMMMLPYLRILPMHLTILFGLPLAGGSAGAAMLLFGVLKTLGDHWSIRAEDAVRQKMVPKRSAYMSRT
jgi:hypothetical protein